MGFVFYMLSGYNFLVLYFIFLGEMVFLRRMSGEWQIFLVLNMFKEFLYDNVLLSYVFYVSSYSCYFFSKLSSYFRFFLFMLVVSLTMICWSSLGWFFFFSVLF